MQLKMAYVVALVKLNSERKNYDYKNNFLYVSDRLIKPAPIIYNRIGVRAKNLLFDDIFAGSHHFFLKVHGHDWILGGGLNNFNQLGNEENYQK